MRKRAKVDQTHQPIVDAFRKGGWNVLSLAPLGNGCPDLLVWKYHRGFSLIEVKTGKRPLRVDQELFAAKWPVRVLRSQDEAIQFMQERT
jgi:hypothetical protein